VAAAARNEFEAALRDVIERLAGLQRQFGQPSELETRIEWFSSEVDATALSVRWLQNTMGSPVLEQAVEDQFRKLEWAVDAFRNYVQSRGNRTDAEHVIDRTTVAANLWSALGETIGFFAKLN
jgi:methionine synthase II (cobalamin-independent)